MLQKVEHWNKVMRAQGLREAPGFRVSFRIDEFQSLYLRRTKHACRTAVTELRHRMLAIRRMLSNRYAQMQIVFPPSGEHVFTTGCRIVALQTTEVLWVRARAENALVMLKHTACFRAQDGRSERVEKGTQGGEAR